MEEHGICTLHKGSGSRSWKGMLEGHSQAEQTVPGSDTEEGSSTCVCGCSVSSGLTEPDSRAGSFQVTFVLHPTLSSTGMLQ